MLRAWLTAVAMILVYTCAATALTIITWLDFGWTAFGIVWGVVLVGAGWLGWRLAHWISEREKEERRDRT